MAAAANRARRGVRGADARKRACELSRRGHNGVVAAAAAAAAAAAVEPAAAAAGTITLAKQDFRRTNKSAELRRTKGLLSMALNDREKLAVALVQQRKLHEEDVERHEVAKGDLFVRQKSLELGGQRSRLEVVLLQAYRDIAELRGQKSETKSDKDESSEPTCLSSGCPRSEEVGNISGGGGGGGGGDNGRRQEPSKRISSGPPSPVPPGSSTGLDTFYGGDDKRGNDDDRDSDGHDRDEKLSPPPASGSCSGWDTPEGSDEGSTDDDDDYDEGNDDDDYNHGETLPTGDSSGWPSFASDSSYDGSFTYDGNDPGDNPGDGFVGPGAPFSVPPPPPPPSQQKQ
ncbi:unnamed protein product [Ectocarpus sp. 13 AM-2016]